MGFWFVLHFSEQSPLRQFDHTLPLPFMIRSMDIKCIMHGVFLLRCSTGGGGGGGA